MKKPLTWPAIPPFYLKDGSQLDHDPPYTDAELTALRFDGVPEFHTDGVGVSTPEFREQREKYLFDLKVNVRLARHPWPIKRRAGELHTGS